MIKKTACSFCINGFSDDFDHIVLQGVVSKIVLVKDWNRAADPMSVRDILLRNGRCDVGVCHWTKPHDS